MIGATIQAQTNCQTIEGHLGGVSIVRVAWGEPSHELVVSTYHSQPLPCFMAISMGELPYTSVPGIPKSEWNLRDIM